jgi:hypothetical protein
MGVLLILILITLAVIYWELIKANRYLKAIAERRPPAD